MSKSLHSDTSTSSLDKDDLISSEQIHIRNFARQMLKGRLFIGIFHEKRYIETLNSYRDVVSVSKHERDLINDLVAVKNRIENHFAEDHWTGITTPDLVGAPANHCVWVVLPEDHAFGQYWFKIKSVKFKRNEASLRLQVVRPVDATVGEAKPNDAAADDVNISLDEIKRYFKTNLSYFVGNVATARNTKETIVFLFVVLVAVVTGSFQLLQFLCDFLLKFMRELTYFVRSASPIFLACINLVGRSINGFYMLVAIMWRDRKSNDRVHGEPYYARSYKPMIDYNVGGDGSHRTYQRQLMMPRTPGNRVIITEME